MCRLREMLREECLTGAGRAEDAADIECGHPQLVAWHGDHRAAHVRCVAVVSVKLAPSALLHWLLMFMSCNARHQLARLTGLRHARVSRLANTLPCRFNHTLISIYATLLRHTGNSPPPPPGTRGCACSVDVPLACCLMDSMRH